MPETDWLTGLSSRAAFARHVRQADRDRDHFAVAIVGIRRIEEINRRLGFDVGDNLLRTIGTTLGGRTAVGTTAARLGGAQFGMMTVGAAAEDMMAWCEPVVSAVTAALTEWTFEQIEFDGDCPIQPELVMGAAGGFSGRVWADAALALDQAEMEADDRPGRANLIVHDPADPRLIIRREQEALNTRVDQALDGGSLTAMTQEIEVIGRSDLDQRWIRLSVADNQAGAINISALSADVGSRVERWLAEEAASLITSHIGQLRVTIPVLWEVGSGAAFADHLSSLLDRLMVPTSRLVIETDEAALSDAGAIGQAFVRSIATAGSSLVLAGCDGGHRTTRAVAANGVRYVKPAPALATAAANADGPARLVLRALSQIVTDRGLDLIAPASTVEDRCLAELGITYAERPKTVGVTGSGASS